MMKKYIKLYYTRSIFTNQWRNRPCFYMSGWYILKPTLVSCRYGKLNGCKMASMHWIFKCTYYTSTNKVSQIPPTRRSMLHKLRFSSTLPSKRQWKPRLIKPPGSRRLRKEETINT